MCSFSLQDCSKQTERYDLALANIQDNMFLVTPTLWICYLISILKLIYDFFAVYFRYSYKKAIVITSLRLTSEESLHRSDLRKS